MKKIMFNDRFGLTDAVLRGDKTQTRRVVSDRITEKYYAYDEWCSLVSGDFPVERQYPDMESYAFYHCPYKAGEIVAVAMSYKSIYERAGSWEYAEEYRSKHEHLAGWTNKMFTNTEMPFAKIKITGIRVERLQDISEDDCIDEGVMQDDDAFEINDSKEEEGCSYFYSARAAYAFMIDVISGKGTWESNPWVFVYDFELVE